ncbi:unnamed protein product [Schistosoma turkestanicum]|nr:unnamed protein product [Schistosoma turkestanicum]
MNVQTSLKSELNRSTVTNLCGWSEQNVFHSVYRKPTNKITGVPGGSGSNAGSGVIFGKSERFTYQKPVRICKEYKFYHYDNPHAYILQYRRDCTSISNLKDSSNLNNNNNNKGPLQEFHDLIDTELNDQPEEKLNINQTNDESLSEHLPAEPLHTAATNHSHSRSPGMKMKPVKSGLTTTTSGNRHLWVNNFPPTSDHNHNHINKLPNTNINSNSSTNANHTKQKLPKKVVVISHHSCSSRPGSGKLSDNKTNLISNGTGLIPVPRIESATKSHKEPVINVTTIQQQQQEQQEQQPIHNASHPGFWPLLYKKLIELKAERATHQTED